MSDYDTFLFLHSAYIRVRDIIFFQDLDDQVDSLKIVIESKREFSDEQVEQLYGIIQENWKRALREICESTIERINTRKTRGETFSDIREDIHQLIKESQNDLKIDEYHTIFKQLQRDIDKMEEKISVERFNLAIAGFGVLIGFLLGLLGSYFLKIWGYC